MKSKLYLDQYLLKVNVVSIVFLLIFGIFWYLQLLQLNPKEFIQIVFT